MLSAIYEGMFVTPCIDGFVLVIDVPQGDLAKEKLERYTSGFSEFQYFGTHRVVEYHSRAKYVDGMLHRGYAYVGDGVDVTWDDGLRTEEK